MGINRIKTINEIELELLIVKEVMRRLEHTKMSMDEALRAVETVRHRLTEVKLEFKV